MALLGVVELELMIVGWLDFFSCRRLNCVNRYYRSLLNAEFVRLYPKDEVSDQLRRMIHQKDQEACQWLFLRNRYRRYHLEWVIETGDLDFLQAILQRGPISTGCVYRCMEVAFRQADSRIASVVSLYLQQTEDLTKNFAENPSRIYQYSTKVMDWFSQIVPTTGPVAWPNQSPDIELLLREAKREAIQWTHARGVINWNLAVRNLRWPSDLWASKDPLFFRWLQDQYGADFSDSYEKIFWHAHQHRQTNVQYFITVLSWLASNHYCRNKQYLEKFCQDEALDLIRLYQLLHSRAQYRSLLQTQNYRYPPYSPAIYHLLEEIFTSLSSEEPS